MKHLRPKNLNKQLTDQHGNRAKACLTMCEREFVIIIVGKRVFKVVVHGPEQVTIERA